MKIQEYREKRAKYDPVAWSKCNICKEKYPNDEIVHHIHQKHPEKDCSTFSCWTCGIRFRKEIQMKRHMKTVKHQLEAKKYTIPDEDAAETEVQLILLNPETDMSNTEEENLTEHVAKIQSHKSSDTDLIDSPKNMTTNETLLNDIQENLEETESDEPQRNQGKLEDINQYILNDQTGIFEERKKPKATTQKPNIEEIVDHLLEALDEPGDKEEIMEYIHKEDDEVELEIDDWLTMDSWGNTPAVEDLIPLGIN